MLYLNILQNALYKKEDNILDHAKITPVKMPVKLAQWQAPTLLTLDLSDETAMNMAADSDGEYYDS
jgi:hypothetical protein